MKAMMAIRQDLHSKQPTLQGELFKSALDLMQSSFRPQKKWFDEPRHLFSPYIAV